MSGGIIFLDCTGVPVRCLLYVEKLYLCYVILSVCTVYRTIQSCAKGKGKGMVYTYPIYLKSLLYFVLNICLLQVVLSVIKL